MASHEVVVVGGNFAGVHVCHYLLQKVFPALKEHLPDTTFHVTMISPNTHFFFKIAAPRFLLKPGAFDENKIFWSIAEGFKQYDESSFKHILGKAVGSDPQARTVSVELSSGSEKQTIKYDSLVIASGTTSTSPLWTLQDTHDETHAAHKALHQALPKASTVLVVGAGPVGVETAGEIASEFPNAKVTLVSGSDHVLPGQPATLGDKAKQALEALGVTVKLSVRLTDQAASDDTRPVKLSDGSSETPDIFINATGPLKMNTEWLPKDWLDKDGRVLTRDTWFRVKGEPAEVKGVWVMGDLVSGSKNTSIENDAMTSVVCSGIGIDALKAAGKELPTEDGGILNKWNPFAKAPVLHQAEFKPMEDTIFVTIGPNGGVGQLHGWGVPSFMVKKGKAERFLAELIEPHVTGSKWK